IGMTIFAKDLAENENVYLSEKVIKIDILHNSVNIICDSNKTFEAKKIVMTCPLPQSLEILKTSDIDYPKDLNTILYGKAIVGLLEFNSENNTQYDFNLLKPNSNIFTIANNQAKGISNKLALSVVMSESWSDYHFNLEDTELLHLIQIELQKHFNSELPIIKCQLKKWRYAQPSTVYNEKHVSLNNGQIIIAGDAFGGGSIAGALRSANSAFEFLNTSI
ncbi:MAG: FAD-dependent oxidoreductase, partial [Pseudobdellovibrio sp.]